MARPRAQRNLELLRWLSEESVEFCIVGGVAAALHGSTRVTVDLDIAAPFSEHNLRRLVKALAPHDARHATNMQVRLAEEPMQRLKQFRLMLLETALGRIDILREVTPLGSFADLEVVEMDLGPLRCDVISLEQLIAVKRSLSRPKDLEVALELEAILEKGG